jgi:hypothetical protein
VLFAAGLATAQTPSVGSTLAPVSTTTTLSGGQLRVAERIAAPFATLAGSQENALALTTALRTGTPATLTYTTTSSTTQTTTTTTTTITPPTAPMGWGNVSHALALARYSLAQAGVTSPTGADLNAALAGGEVRVAGQAVPLSGVLAQRASGMGWGQIARSYGTTMGAVNRSLRSGTTATATAPVRDAQPALRAATTRATVASTDGRRVRTVDGITSGHGSGVASTTTASSAPATGRGLTTATGSASSHAAKGLTTAGGAASRGTAIVAADGGSGHGASNARGRGIVTASGSSAGAGAAGASRTTSAAVTGNQGVAGRMPASTDVGGNGGGHGRGKGG